MSLSIYDSTPAGNGLFNAQAAFFKTITMLTTEAGTTLPASVETALTAWEALSVSDDLGWQDTASGVESAVTTWQNNTATLSRSLAATAGNLLVHWADDNEPQPDSSTATALAYLIEYMTANAYYVTPSALTGTLTAGGSNDGDAAIFWTLARGDGMTEYNAIAETLNVNVTTAGQAPSIQFLDSTATTNRLDPTWPTGSGCNRTITATDPVSSELSNGDFEDTTYDDDIPDGWIVAVGTPGTTITVTNPEVQSVAIAGTPTGGSYILQWAYGGVTRATGTILYNASASSVQSALRTIPGLESVTVTATGTSPNYTHSVTFTGQGGDPAQLTSVSHLTGGSPSITHGTTTAGDPGSYKGRALKFASNGSEVTAVYHPLFLTADVVYFCHFRLKATGTAIAAGEVRVEIVDGIGGSVVNDSAGTANELVITGTDIGTTSHDSRWFAFRVPATTTMPCYLRLRISTAVTSGANIYWDEMVVVQGVQLYAGGPWVAAAAGLTPTPVTDSWTLAVTNDRAGKLQEFYNRCFNMVDSGLLLPTTGTSLIPESLLS